MAMSVIRTGWRSSAALPLKYTSVCQRPSQNSRAPSTDLSNSLSHVPARTFFGVPLGMDIGLVGIAAYYITKLKKPELSNVLSIFGPDPYSRESEVNPDKVVKVIAHRGAGLDAPENTMEAFKYCADNDCNFIELDVRTSRDGKLVLLHDPGLERLAGSVISDVRAMDWDTIKNIDVGVSHPNRNKYKEVKLCLLDDAVDFCLSNNMRMIIDVKGDDKQVVEGILKIYEQKPALHKSAAITSFNPFTLYQIRKKNPDIVGAISYRPYAFSAQDYDAETGPTNPRFGDNPALHLCLRALDMFHGAVWRWTARWCSVSAVLLHKDIVSASEVQYWRSLGIRCCGWSVNRPLEKLYWRGVLKAPYLANTLVGEPDISRTKEEKGDTEGPGSVIDKILESENRKITSGQH